MAENRQDLSLEAITVGQLGAAGFRIVLAAQGPATIQNQFGLKLQGRSQDGIIPPVK
jgi:hypothetical protein